MTGESHVRGAVILADCAALGPPCGATLYCGVWACAGVRSRAELPFLSRLPRGEQKSPTPCGTGLREGESRMPHQRPNKGVSDRQSGKRSAHVSDPGSCGSTFFLRVFFHGRSAPRLLHSGRGRCHPPYRGCSKRILLQLVVPLLTYLPPWPQGLVAGLNRCRHHTLVLCCLRPGWPHGGPGSH